MPTISDIDQLQSLEAIGREIGVSFTLHGGTVFRFVSRLILNNDSIPISPDGEAISKKVDLYDICPFTADIDLVHSGPAAKTRHVLDAILECVPGAECFRWEIRSADENEPY